ncbi:MAG: DUF1028 domain-containing protein [Deltaproteobacteria bacterium]|nr:DUF1028 domain-containing protein [Deltaproteobacteria bacterium]
MRNTAALWTLVLALAAPPAEATYSIVGTDTATGQVGGAGTSCVGSMSVYVIYGSAPGHGAVHAQSYVNEAGRDEAARLLALDTPPADIIAAITAPGFDWMASRRQYGIADLSGRAAGFTGSDNGDHADDLQGSIETFTYSIQGNILTGAAVLDQAVAAFEGEGCDLADRLMLALEAGAEGGGGDSRCTPGGIPSDSAFIHVDLEDGTEYLHISVEGTAPTSPLLSMRSRYAAWRADHPCDEPAEEDPVDASTDAWTDPTLDPADDPVVDDPSLDPIGEEGEMELSTGCGCSLPGSGPAGAIVLLLGLIAIGAAFRGQRR